MNIVDIFILFSQVLLLLLLFTYSLPVVMLPCIRGEIKIILELNNPCAAAAAHFQYRTGIHGRLTGVNINH